jgi:hypothetical protein
MYLVIFWPSLVFFCDIMYVFDCNETLRWAIHRCLFYDSASLHSTRLQIYYNRYWPSVDYEMINESLISLSEMNNQIIFQSVGLLLTFYIQYPIYWFSLNKHKNRREKYFISIYIRLSLHIRMVRFFL